MRTIEELTFGATQIQSTFEEKVLAEVQLAAESRRVGRGLCRLNRDLVGAHTDTLKIPSDTWSAAGTIAVGGTYTFAEPSLGTVTITTVKRGVGVEIPYEWVKRSAVDLISYEIEKLGISIAEGEDKAILETLVGLADAGTVTAGTATGTTCTVTLGNKPLLSVDYVGIGTAGQTATSSYSFDAYDGKVKVDGCASDDVIKIAYKYSTRSYYQHANSYGSVDYIDFANLKGNMMGNRHEPNTAVVAPLLHGKILNAMKSWWVDSAEYTPVIKGEVGQLAGMHFLVSQYLPEDVIMAIDRNKAAIFAVEDEVKVKRVEAEDADNIKIRAFCFNGVGVVYEKGIYLSVDHGSMAEDL